jgi:micrococcal nuclease
MMQPREEQPMNPGTITRHLPSICGLAAMLLAVLPLHAARPAPASAAVEGIVSKVHDGDSLWLTPPDKPPIVVRLRDIDAPEICQIYGEEARLALAELALNRKAVLKTAGRDPHGRMLGVVLVDGVDLGLRMVEEGHAWSIRSKWDQGPLVRQERMAQALSRGLWARGGAVKPSDFRQAYGPCGGAGAVEARSAPSPAPAPPPRTATAPVPHTATVAAPAAVSNNFRCDGRTYCSQMKSCDEARYFLANCPGTKMDGDGDGVPCEDQWCGKR